MIALTLRFDESAFSSMDGREAGRFFLAMLVEDPAFAMKAADEIEVKGDFGRFVEER